VQERGLHVANWHEHGGLTEVVGRVVRRADDGCRSPAERDARAGAEAEHVVDDRFARSAQAATFDHMRITHPAGDDAEDVDVAPLQQVARLHERVGPPDTRLCRELGRDRCRDEARRRERSGALRGDDELVGVEQRDDAGRLVLEVLDGPGHEEGEAERDRRRQHRQHETPPAVHQVVQPHPPHAHDV